MNSLTLGILVWALGLCIGSFLNVVIYRLPLGLSVSQPRWSFCPRCRSTLRWFENLPVLSWIALRGRCRSCRAPISVQYPLVEAATGLAFLIAWRLLFVDGAHRSIGQAVYPTDLPLLLAWLTLIAAMIATSVMDLMTYMIDIAVTNLAVAIGVVLMAIWPRPKFLIDQASSPWMAAGAAAMAIGLVLWWRNLGKAPQQEAMDSPESPDTLDGEGAKSDMQAKPGGFGAGLLAALGFLAISAWIVLARRPEAEAPHLTADLPAGFLALFAAILMCNSQPRDVDQELYDTIEEEAPQARRAALRELAWLMPSILGGAVLGICVAWVPAVAATWNTLVSVQVSGFSPLAGAAYGLFGVALGAALGWIVRIVFTLAFGREAFGVGDIYILAAAGATAGPEIAALGFVLSIAVALLGWIVSLLLKRSVMIPFGPPLALGFLLALWAHRPAAGIVGGYVENIRSTWEASPSMIFLLAGVLVVGTGISIVLARVIRRLVEGPDQQAG